MEAEPTHGGRGRRRHGKEDGMKLRYFLIDADGQLKRLRRDRLEALWQGNAAAADLGSRDACELRLVSVLCDDRLVPQKIFLLRLPLTRGRFTKENYRTLRSFSRPDRVTAHEMFRHHSEGWPRDFFPQLAVALDVPKAFLDVPLGIGGPLLMAAALRLPPKQAVRYLR
jgi:hypothetical protein